MWLDVVASPDPAHAGLTDPLRHRQGPATPMRVSFGLGLQSGINHGLDANRIVTGIPWSPDLGGVIVPALFDDQIRTAQDVVVRN